jgi:hypothetical protein
MSGAQDFDVTRELPSGTARFKNKVTLSSWKQKRKRRGGKADMPVCSY